MYDPLASDFFDPPPQKGPRPLLRFYTEPTEMPAKSEAEGRKVYEDVDYVGITNPGSRDELVVRADKKAKTDEYVAWAYRKWKATQEQVTDGTPLETVPFLGKAQIMELKALAVHSLETLAQAPEAVLQRMMGARELKKKAEAYLKAASDTQLVTKLTGELEKRDLEIAMLKEQITKVNERFEKLLQEKAS